MSILLETTNINSTRLENTAINRVYFNGNLVFGSAPLVGGSGAFTVGTYWIGLSAPGGGQVTQSFGNDGATYGDSAGWYSPLTNDIGTGKWIIFTQTAGTLSCTSAALGTRVQLNSLVSIMGEYFGSASRFATITVEIYNASTGGTLLDSGTLTLEVDGNS
jgi:hypothetical protein